MYVHFQPYFVQIIIPEYNDDEMTTTTMTTRLIYFLRPPLVICDHVTLN